MVLFAASVVAFVILIFRTDLNLLEFVGLMAAWVVAFTRRPMTVRKPAWQVSRFHGFARKRGLTSASVGALVVLLRLAMLPIDPV
jgi:hypothetical protein